MITQLVSCQPNAARGSSVSETPHSEEEDLNHLLEKAISLVSSWLSAQILL